jgi:hypothetical protein
LCHDRNADDKLWRDLDAEDARVALKVKAAGCRYCGGRLDVASYPRKPRGCGLGDWLEKRRSFSCAREGCRRRATPPSLVFLGRRVYVAVVVLVESLRAALTEAATPTLPPHTSPPPRTTRRWLDWFRTSLPRTALFTAATGRFWPPLSPAALPQALMTSFERPGRSASEVVISVLRFLSPLSTTSVPLEAALARD